ncbi:CesT family type III secretion system chaperone [Nitratidesulfovibrio vulgaris]|uniref:Type III secretion chaperone, CesT family n=1 Tax=Nitratidesulfovibrio vulgaris (strain ATCC 29579 / DSM 644 / CCUG 34227 / NCIMB 8303 / VKM B-1760 / Hildenborough) TaxID=882 RepID=Q729F9_NITV2|nr:CesT family type III secretion system chaperone [Nitratidesulfovibrio vulgaris]AAS96865.1 type III secretion chaperone, CesT family [Nitratidesulfovibrio vulgaris str. Hildenborough]ADP87357.1 Tir chaperone family protein [Nitratidesulfovibrio vulgaris RCH1]HBW14611.1 CesT family type III secretion system chaperone [Desulfovibrio sp.]
MSTIEKIIEEFGERTGIAGFALDADGTCVLSFDDIVVNLELVRDKARLYAFTVITLMPDDDVQAMALCRYALEQNLSLAISGAGILGLSQQHGLLFANAIGTEQLDLTAFEAFLETHVNVSEGLRQATQAIGAETPATDAAILQGMALRV